MNWQRQWERGTGWATFVETAMANAVLWRELTERARVPDTAVERVEALGRRVRLLVLGADWCGDAVNTLPVVARLTERASNLELRHLDRDEFPEVMDAHLTNGARSIPVVIALDEAGQELGWWGPRPTELQRWFVTEGKQLPPDERYRRLRGWYARDRGGSTVEEIVAMLESTGSRRATA